MEGLGVRHSPPVQMEGLGVRHSPPVQMEGLAVQHSPPVRHHLKEFGNHLAAPAAMYRLCAALYTLALALLAREIAVRRLRCSPGWHALLDKIARASCAA
jgi:hypothetical protein